MFRLVNEKRRNATGHTERYVHERSKSGSTVIDSTRSSNLAPGRNRKYVDQRQGLQAGWSDWYIFIYIYIYIYKSFLVKFFYFLFALESIILTPRVT